MNGLLTDLQRVFASKPCGPVAERPIARALADAAEQQMVARITHPDPGRSALAGGLHSELLRPFRASIPSCTDRGGPRPTPLQLRPAGALMDPLWAFEEASPSPERAE